MTVAEQESSPQPAPREAWPRLMARAQRGDGQAYARLLTSLLPAIRALIRRQITDPLLTEDVIQDVLLSLHRVRHTYDPRCPFLPWLTAIVSARSTDALRRRGRDRRWHPAADGPNGDVSEPPDAPAARGDEPGFSLHQRDRQRELQGILGQLPLRQREVVEDIHLREMSLAEAASKSQLSVAAVKSLLHRALTTLRRYGEKNDRSS